MFHDFHLPGRKWQFMRFTREKMAVHEIHDFGKIDNRFPYMEPINSTSYAVLKKKKLIVCELVRAYMNHAKKKQKM